MNLFIVDDDKFILEIFIKLFKVNGFDVIDTATNGEEAVIKFQNFLKKPDIIIMDYHMPYKNGVEATKAILDIDHKAKIVIISGDLSVKDEILASGAICFIEKPLHISKIIQEVNKLKSKIRNRIEC